MSHKIITIARQFGSGGHEVGERLSKLLQIPLYDRSLVEMAAEKMGLSPITVEEVDEAALHSFLSTYRIPKTPNDVTGYGLPLNDSTYLTQTAIIETLAKEGPCIIVGRCGDYILRNYPDLIDVFLCASMEDRVKRIMERYELGERSAKEAIREMDKSRRQYYEKYTDRKWGDRSAHQVIFNVSLLGMENTVNAIRAMYLAMDGIDEVLE